MRNKNSPRMISTTIRTLSAAIVNQASAISPTSIAEATRALTRSVIATGHRYPAARMSGAQGRIRTSVARKERQIYSLLPLTARPPVHNLFDPSHTQLEILIASWLTASHSRRGDRRQPPLVRCNLSWQEFTARRGGAKIQPVGAADAINTRCYQY